MSRSRTPIPPTSSPSSASKTDMDEAEGELQLTSQEIRFLQNSWDKVSGCVDVGAELVARLLNDHRLRFRALIEQHSSDVLGTGKICAEDVTAGKFKRAKAVGDGVVAFFNKAMLSLSEPDHARRVRDMSLQLGALHFRLRVWFQAENWLCVKNCLLDSIMESYAKKHSHSFGCIRPEATHEKAATTWYKLIVFIIRNMKKGFLQEALGADSQNTPASSQPSPPLSDDNSSEHSV